MPRSLRGAARAAAPAALATFLAALAVLPAAAATVLFEDDFDGDRLASNPRALSKWTIVSGNVDVIGPGFFDFYPGNGNYVDMDGSAFGAGHIRSNESFLLEAGARYRITFLLGKNGTAAERLRFGLTDVRGFTIDQPPGAVPALEAVTRTVTAAADMRARLFFRAAGGDSQGPIIDGVLLTRLDPKGGRVPAPSRVSPPAPVPLAPALGPALAGLGALGLAGLRRLRARLSPPA